MTTPDLIRLLAKRSTDGNVSVMKEGKDVFISSASPDMVISVRVPFLAPSKTFSGASFPGAALAALVQGSGGSADLTMESAKASTGIVLAAGGHRFIVQGEHEDPPKGTPRVPAAALALSGEVSMGNFPIILHQGYAYQANETSLRQIDWAHVAAVSPDPAAEAFDQPVALGYGSLSKQILSLFAEDEEVAVWASPRWVQLVGKDVRLIVRHLPDGLELKSRALEVLSRIGDGVCSGAISDLSEAAELVSDLPVHPGDYRFTTIDTSPTEMLLSVESYAGRLFTQLPVTVTGEASGKLAVQPAYIKLAMNYLKRSGSERFFYHEADTYIHFTDGAETAVMIAGRNR